MTPVTDNPLAALDDACPDDMPERFQDLCLTLQQRFGMPWDDAAAVARTVEDLFNGRRELDDEALDKELRAMFYDLQAKDVLRIRREEFNSSEGKTLRAFYWRLNEETLEEARRKAARSHAERATESSTQDDVYDKLPEEAWARTAA